MARQTGYMITFNDAIFMVNNEGFEQNQSIPSNNTCMTRSDIETYLNVDTAFSDFSSYSSNQLVPYDFLKPVPITLAWRPIDPICEEEVDTFSVTPTTYNISKNQQSVFTSITSNTTWSAVSNDTFLTLPNTSGAGDNSNFEIRISENTGENSRTGTITLTGAGQTITITVNQEPTITLAWRPIDPICEDDGT